MTVISGWELRVRTVGIGNWESGLWELGLGIWDFRLRSSWKESSCGGNLDYFRSSHATSARIGILECGNWELGIWTVETERELGFGDPDSGFVGFLFGLCGWRHALPRSHLPQLTRNVQCFRAKSAGIGNPERGNWELGIQTVGIGNWDLVCAVPGTRYHGPACHSSPGTW